VPDNASVASCSGVFCGAGLGLSPSHEDRIEKIKMLKKRVRKRVFIIF
jgi:hypothetical protein